MNKLTYFSRINSPEKTADFSRRRKMTSKKQAQKKATYIKRSHDQGFLKTMSWNLAVGKK